MTTNDIQQNDGASDTAKASHSRAGSKRDRHNVADRRHGLVAGRLPPGYRHVTVVVGQLRQGLEAAVLAARGAVSLPDAASINTAARWETHSLLCLRELRNGYASLLPTERAKLSEQAASASARRDAAIEKLDLGGDANSAYAWPTAASVLPRLPDARSDDDAPEANDDAGTSPATAESNLEGN